MITEQAGVLSSEKLSEGIFSMWVETAVAKEALPGQFAGLYPGREDTLLQRPISICEIDKKAGAIRLVYRVAGKGTDWLSKCKAGDTFRILGPCGNGFDTKKAEGLSLLVGGGIGVPPMLELGKALADAGKDFKFVLGYRNSDMFLYEDFAKVSGEENILIATDDGSAGVHGTVVDAITSSGLKAGTVFACGPMPMLRALKGYASQAGIKAWISLEERMACGVGACLGCVCRTVNKDEHSMVNNARVCVEGPVFDAEDVDI